MEGASEKQYKKQNYDWLKPYQFKKGESGNPDGRPPGKSLKTYVREYFENLPDEQKMAFLNQVDPKTAWEMAEGKPDTKSTLDAKIEHSADPELKKSIDSALSELM